MTTTEIVRLYHARRVGTYKGRPSYQAKCPCHSDRMASLSITEPEPGRTKVKCFAACDELDVLGAKGLTVGDLYAKKKTFSPPPKPPDISLLGPVWIHSSQNAMEIALACSMLLAFAPLKRGGKHRYGWAAIWNKENGQIPDPDNFIRGSWDVRPPDGYMVHPWLRTEVLESLLRRAIFSWYRMRYWERRNIETQRIIRHYGFEELWDCLPMARFQARLLNERKKYVFD